MTDDKAKADAKAQRDALKAEAKALDIAHAPNLSTPKLAELVSTRHEALRAEAEAKIAAGEPVEPQPVDADGDLIPVPTTEPEPNPADPATVATDAPSVRYSKHSDTVWCPACDHAYPSGQNPACPNCNAANPLH